MSKETIITINLDSIVDRIKSPPLIIAIILGAYILVAAIG